MKKIVLTLAAVLMLGAATSARAASPELAGILRQMDAASANFHSAQAEFKWDQYTKVVDSTDTQTGTVYFKHSAATTQMAAQVRQLNGTDDPKTVVFDGSTLKLYQPRIKQITVFSASKNKGQIDSFLTLGFGGSGADLARTWDITLVGMEKMKDGGATVDVAHLDLVPKQQSVRDMFSKVSIWIDPARGVSLKQIFVEPSGDARTAYYSGIKVNSQIDARTFALDAKALGAQVVNH